MSCCDFEKSQISAQDTVGVAGDDIMFHIIVGDVIILSCSQYTVAIYINTI